MTLYWHVHHDRLFEDCWDYETHKAYILKEKPKEKRELHLRLFKPVQDVEAVAPAREAYGKAFTLAKDDFDKATDPAWKAREKSIALARETCDEAAELVWETFYKAIELAWETYYKAVVKIHQRECPDCPWNGKTIFP